jgi:OOP family OmpA-OmpF porin
VTHALLNSKKRYLASACALAFSVAAGAAGAELSPADTGYLSDQRGTVVRSGHGLCWHTGSGPAQVAPSECGPIVVAAPAPVLAAPSATRVEPAAEAQQPVAVAAVTPPAPLAVERVTLDADALFDFDKAELRPEGRAALDQLVGRIAGIDADTMMAVGHTDRFGSERYNQRLSERRAGAVKAYLVGKGIEPDRVRTEGRGATQPVTVLSDCAGAKSAGVIACLQPDRRVEVEVTGTRTIR